MLNATAAPSFSTSNNADCVDVTISDYQFSMTPQAQTTITAETPEPRWGAALLVLMFLAACRFVPSGVRTIN